MTKKRLTTRDTVALDAFVRERCPSKRLGEGGEHEGTCPGCAGLLRTLLAFMEALAPAGNGDPPCTAANAMLDAFAGSGCLGRSAPDEPVFVLVARDRAAAHTVLDWVVQVERVAAALDVPVPPAKLSGAVEVARQMIAWRQAHDDGKVPD